MQHWNSAPEERERRGALNQLPVSLFCVFVWGDEWELAVPPPCYLSPEPGPSSRTGFRKVEKLWTLKGERENLPCFSTLTTPTYTTAKSQHSLHGDRKCEVKAKSEAHSQWGQARSSTHSSTLAFFTFNTKVKHIKQMRQRIQLQQHTTIWWMQLNTVKQDTFNVAENTKANFCTLTKCKPQKEKDKFNNGKHCCCYHVLWKWSVTCKIEVCSFQKTKEKICSLVAHQTVKHWRYILRQ